MLSLLFFQSFNKIILIELLLIFKKISWKNNLQNHLNYLITCIILRTILTHIIFGWDEISVVLKLLRPFKVFWVSLPCYEVFFCTRNTAFPLRIVSSRWEMRSESKINFFSACLFSKGYLTFTLLWHFYNLKAHSKVWDNV